MTSSTTPLEIGPEAETFLKKLLEIQAQIKDSVSRAINYYEELTPTTRAQLKDELAKVGGVLVFGGLILPAAAREKLGITDPLSTMHGAAGGGQFREMYPGGISLCGDLRADATLAINLLLSLGPKTGLDGMLMLNAALGVINVLMTQHLGGQKIMVMSMLAEAKQQMEEMSKEADAILLARAKESGSA